MNNVLLLTRLQILESIGGFRATIEKRAGKSGALLGTAIIGLFVFVGVAWMGYAAYGLLGGPGLDKAVFDALFIACGALTFVFSLPAILGSFFSSSDINDLLALPVSPFAIVFSKALSALTSSYLWTLVFIAGPLAGWGIASGAGIHYWVTYLLAVIFTPMMPTAYAGTIAIIVASVFKGVRRKDTVTTITTVLTLAISVGGVFISNQFRSSSGIAAVLGSMSEGMGSVVMAFPAYGFAVYGLSHPDPLGWLMFALLSLAAFAVFVVVARVLYLRIVTSLSSGGGSAAYDGAEAQRQAPAFKSLVMCEVRKIARNSSVLLYYVGYPVLLSPLMFGIMLVNGSLRESLAKLGAVNADVTDMVTGFALAAITFLIVLFTTSNRLAATAVSRDGSNWMHMKFIPVPMITQVRAKILPAFVVSALIVTIFSGVGAYILVGILHVNALMSVCGFVLALGASWLMTCVQALHESRNPNVEWGNDDDVNIKTLKGGGGELRALLVGLVYSLLPLLVTPLVGLDPTVFMPVLAVAAALVAVVLGNRFLATAAHNIETFE